VAAGEDALWFAFNGSVTSGQGEVDQCAPRVVLTRNKPTPHHVGNMSGPHRIGLCPFLADDSTPGWYILTWVDL
jgi:hypothetical protein